MINPSAPGWMLNILQSKKLSERLAHEYGFVYQNRKTGFIYGHIIVF
jgi:hypothetical protein